MENTASTVEIPVQEKPSEDPLSRAGPTEAPAPTIAACTHDCKTCIVMAVRNRDGQRLSRTGAAELQHAFDRQALGFSRPADEYSKTLVQQERAMETMREKVKGCHQVTNGTRVMVESLLHHAEGVFAENVKREKSLYVSTLPTTVEPRPEKPFVPPEPRATVLHAAARTWSGFMEKAVAYFG